MSFATNEAMFAIHMAWDEYWEWRLSTKKWQRFLLLIMVTAATFDSRIKSNIYLFEYSEAVRVEDEEHKQKCPPVKRALNI